MAKDPVRKALKLLVLASASTCFLCQMGTISRQYLEGATTASLEYVGRKSLLLPSVTVCSSVPYKWRDAMFTEEDFLEGTFAAEEIFDNATLSEFDDGDEGVWTVTPVRLRSRGLCFRFDPTRPTGAFDIKRAFVGLRRNASVTFYLHKPKEEFWLSEGLTPRPIPSGRFHQGGDGLQFVDVLLKRRVLHLDERSSRCKVYENQSFKHGQSAAFTDCGIRLLREKFLGEWADRFNCTLHYAKSYLGEAGEAFGECSIPKAKEFAVELEAFMFNVGAELEGVGCPKPCKETTFDYRLLPQHESSLTGGNDQPGMYFYYESTVTEEKRQVPLYDASRFVAAVGGSLGLWLGVSVLSLLWAAVDRWDGKMQLK